MNRIPETFSEVNEIFFIADDATGPFSRAVQWVGRNGDVVTIEGQRALEEFVRWLVQHHPASAEEIKSLLTDPDERNLEVLVYSKAG
jgi:hypothetical protein